MKCIYCGDVNSRVVDSRPIEEGNTIRRRRQCDACGKRFTTYERSVVPPTLVVKRDGSRQLFDPEKIRFGILRAFEHREVDPDQIDEIVGKVDRLVRDKEQEEIPVQEIGDMVLEELLPVDEVAYIRYASVHQRFDNVDQFSKLVREVAERAASGENG